MDRIVAETFNGITDTAVNKLADKLDAIDNGKSSIPNPKNGSGTTIDETIPILITATHNTTSGITIEHIVLKDGDSKYMSPSGIDLMAKRSSVKVKLRSGTDKRGQRSKSMLKSVSNPGAMKFELPSITIKGISKKQVAENVPGKENAKLGF